MAVSDHIDLNQFLKGVKRRNPGQDEFVQAVREEVEDSLWTGERTPKIARARGHRLRGFLSVSCPKKSNVRRLVAVRRTWPLSRLVAKFLRSISYNPMRCAFSDNISASLTCGIRICLPSTSKTP